MKKFIITSILTVLIASLTAVSAGNYPEEYLGLPGDNLNLYATMKLFQESETLEAFERDLNDEKSKINNLDLNGDNLVDYITVTDYVDGNAHTIVLRTALNKKESQDIAVFTVEQFKDGSVQIQLVGDEALYGKNYIVEPIYAETPNPGYKGTTVYTDNVKVVTTTYYEVAAWPVIRFMYNPYYVSWHSSWYWGYYPVYWNPWRPYYWDYYYGYHYNWYNDYYAHYRHCDYYRYHYYDDHYYHGMRQYSSEVAHRVSEGHYTTTYSHPEQRRDGEEMYARTQAGRSADTRRQSSVQSAPSAQRSTADAAGDHLLLKPRGQLLPQHRDQLLPQHRDQLLPQHRDQPLQDLQQYRGQSLQGSLQCRSRSPQLQDSRLQCRSRSPQLQDSRLQCRSRSPQLRDSRLQCRSRSPQLRDSRLQYRGRSPQLRDSRLQCRSRSPQLQDSRLQCRGRSPQLQDSRLQYRGRSPRGQQLPKPGHQATAAARAEAALLLRDQAAAARAEAVRAGAALLPSGAAALTDLTTTDHRPDK